MKKIAKSILIIVLFVGVFLVTGCGKKETPKFDNPKTVTIEGEKGKVEVTYEDNGTFEFNDGEEKILKNTEGNYAFTFSFSPNTIAKQEKLKERNAKADGFTVEDVTYNGYKGYAVINETQAITQVVLYTDVLNEVIFIAKAKPINNTNARNTIKNGANPKDVIYNREEVQNMLNSIKYVK